MLRNTSRRGIHIDVVPAGKGEMLRYCQNNNKSLNVSVARVWLDWRVCPCCYRHVDMAEKQFCLFLSLHRLTVWLGATCSGTELTFCLGAKFLLNAKSVWGTECWSCSLLTARV